MVDFMTMCIFYFMVIVLMKVSIYKHIYVLSTNQKNMIDYRDELLSTLLLIHTICLKIAHGRLQYKILQLLVTLYWFPFIANCKFNFTLV